MKLAIVGGGGVRVPLLVHGLVARGLPFDRIALFDVAPVRLETMAHLARLRLDGVDLTTHRALEPCLDGADFVVTSIRVGGLDAREHDERVSLDHGIAGQETIGPAGFAMAIRTVPVISRYAAEIARVAPHAWVVNFTNPVGIVTQAMHRAARLKLVGVCDTPTELFAEVAHALEVDARNCVFDYVGLNHLGWLREVQYQGRPLLEEIWDQPQVLSRIYARPLFPPDYLARLRLLPTEYVYFYAFPDRAAANLRAAGRTRGRQLAASTRELFAALAQHPPDAVAIYERYIADRSASYMQAETGMTAPAPPSPWAELTGYDRIAHDVIAAILHDTNVVIPLDVPNKGNIPELGPDDVIEPPCEVGRNGPRPLGVGPLPPAVRDLVVQVKEYERATIDAGLDPSPQSLGAALALNPLVPSRAVADRLVHQLRLA
jgi:6-phospho-beta-glucosidase